MRSSAKKLNDMIFFPNWYDEETLIFSNSPE